MTGAPYPSQQAPQQWQRPQTQAKAPLVRPWWGTLIAAISLAAALGLSGLGAWTIYKEQTSTAPPTGIDGLSSLIGSGMLLFALPAVFAFGFYLIKPYLGVLIAGGLYFWGTIGFVLLNWKGW